MTEKWSLMWLKGRIHHSEMKLRTDGRVKRSRDAVHRVVVDQPFEETDRKTTKEDREIADNGDEPLTGKKNTGETEENGRQNPARREKSERAKESHDRCSQPPGMRVLNTADLGTLALLVVNSFKLHLTAS